MSFLQHAAELFQEQSYDVHQERRKRATLFFFAFTALSVLFSFHTSFLLLHLHTIISVNHAISLLAVVLCRAIGRGADAPPSYPFCFGLRRLTVLLRFAGAVFVIFGCLTTVAEAMHVLLHNEPVNLLLASLAALLHAIFLLVYRADVLDADLIAGHGWHASMQSSFSVQQLQRQLLCGAGDEAMAVLQPALWQGRPGSTNSNNSDGIGGVSSGGLRADALAPRRRYSLPRSLWQQVRHRLWRGLRRAADTLRMLLLPLCSLLCCLTSTFASTAHLDVWFALGLALYYLIAGLREGRCMAWHLLNNGVQHDPVLRRLVSNTLQKVELMDGVLQVQTSVWWAASPDQLVAMLRVRLMSGADPTLVTAAVRRALRRVAVFAFVECLSAAGQASHGGALTALVGDEDDDDAGIDDGGATEVRRDAAACRHAEHDAAAAGEAKVHRSGNGEAATLSARLSSVASPATNATPQPAFFYPAAARASGSSCAQASASCALPAYGVSQRLLQVPVSGAMLAAPTPTAFPAPVTGLFTDALGGATSSGPGMSTVALHDDDLGVGSNHGIVHFPPPPAAVYLGSHPIV